MREEPMTEKELEEFNKQCDKDIQKFSLLAFGTFIILCLLFVLFKDVLFI